VTNKFGFYGILILSKS